MSEPTHPFQTVLFDLDGTLVDHFTAIYRSYCHAQQSLGLPTDSYEKVRRSVGGSVPITMERLVGKDLAPEATRLFREFFKSIMLEDLHPLPGSRWILQQLAQRDITCAVFTNKDSEAAEKICEFLGYTRWTTSVFGTHRLPWRKPQPEFTQHVLESLNADPATTLMIGDSPFDVEAAKTHNIACHCVTTGSHTADELNAATFNPDDTWPSLIELGTQLLHLPEPEPVAC